VGLLTKISFNSIAIEAAKMMVNPESQFIPMRVCMLFPFTVPEMYRKYMPTVIKSHAVRASDETEPSDSILI